MVDFSESKMLVATIALKCLPLISNLKEIMEIEWLVSTRPGSFLQRLEDIDSTWPAINSAECGWLSAQKPPLQRH
jgi:hypothetical protein